MLSAGLAAEIELVGDVADQTVVAVAREHHGTVAFLDEFAGGFGADDAHAAGNQDFHLFLSRFSRRRI
jgi:hypothetical protein